MQRFYINSRSFINNYFKQKLHNVCKIKLCKFTHFLESSVFFFLLMKSVLGFARKIVRLGLRIVIYRIVS